MAPTTGSKAVEVDLSKANPVKVFEARLDLLEVERLERALATKDANGNKQLYAFRWTDAADDPTRADDFRHAKNLDPLAFQPIDLDASRAGGRVTLLTEQNGQQLQQMAWDYIDARFDEANVENKRGFDHYDDFQDELKELQRAIALAERHNEIAAKTEAPQIHLPFIFYVAVIAVGGWVGIGLVVGGRLALNSSEKSKQDQVRYDTKKLLDEIVAHRDKRVKEVKSLHVDTVDARSASENANKRLQAALDAQSIDVPVGETALEAALNGFKERTQKAMETLYSEQKAAVELIYESFVERGCLHQLNAYGEPFDASQDLPGHLPSQRAAEENKEFLKRGIAEFLVTRPDALHQYVKCGLDPFVAWSVDDALGKFYAKVNEAASERSGTVGPFAPDPTIGFGR